MTKRRFPGAAAIGTAAAVLLLVGCTHFENWQFVRQRPPETVTTRVNVITEPSDASVFVNGKFMGRSPQKMDLKYDVSARIYQRRVALPYPQIEEKEVGEYTRNVFVIRAVITGYQPAEQKVKLKGQEEEELRLTLVPK
jgi:hypothetical protein